MSDLPWSAIFGVIVYLVYLPICTWHKLSYRSSCLNVKWYAGLPKINPFQYYLVCEIPRSFERASSSIFERDLLLQIPWVSCDCIQMHGYLLGVQIVAHENFDFKFVISVSRLTLELGCSQETRKKPLTRCLQKNRDCAGCSSTKVRASVESKASPINSLTSMRIFHDRNRHFNLKMLFKCPLTIVREAFALRLKNTFLGQYLSDSNWHIYWWHHLVRLWDQVRASISTRQKFISL